jgi:hypothetical protein
MSKKLKVHVITTFLALPLFLGLFFVPFVNIPIFIALSILSIPFAIILEILTPKTFVENHFDYVFSMLGPVDFIGWACLVIYLVMIFNIFALLISHKMKTD